jgi:uncharacterized DUF497 family protein
VKISFDPAKDAANFQKHGIDLAEAEELDWDAALVKPDSRRDYGEARQIGYAPMANRLYCVVFVERADDLRIISLRKANSREVTRYVQEAETDSPDA